MRHRAAQRRALQACFCCGVAGHSQGLDTPRFEGALFCWPGVGLQRKNKGHKTRAVRNTARERDMDNETKEKAAVFAGVAKKKVAGVPKCAASISLLDVSSQHAHPQINKRTHMKLFVFSILLSF